jgi:hypothetical protein
MVRYTLITSACCVRKEHHSETEDLVFQLTPTQFCILSLILESILYFNQRNSNLVTIINPFKYNHTKLQYGVGSKTRRFLEMLIGFIQALCM